MSTRRRSRDAPLAVGEGSAGVFAALGDRRRLHILSRLATEGPLSITGVAKDMDVSRQAVTKHLEILAEAGLVHDERRGRERRFDVEAGSLDRVRRDLDAISARWDRAVARLRDHVER